MAHEEASVVLVDACYAVKCNKCGKTTWKASTRFLGDILFSVSHLDAAAHARCTDMHGDWLAEQGSMIIVVHPRSQYHGIKRMPERRNRIFTHTLSRTDRLRLTDTSLTGVRTTCRPGELFLTDRLSGHEVRALVPGH